MTDQPIDECAYISTKCVALGIRQRIELGDSLGEAVGDRDLPAVEISAEFVLVIAGDDQRRSGPRHRHDESKYFNHPRTAVDQITQKHDAPAFGMTPRKDAVGFRLGVSQFSEEIG